MNKLGDKTKEVAIEHVKQKAARDILNMINEWKTNKILTAQRRWVFELIQNAVDTAKARKNDTLKIEIKRKDNSLIFRHNGGYFTLDEICAIIYGGSTKPFGPESEYIGRFGTGFLVSHIISCKVDVKGYAKEYTGEIYKFKIEINREKDDEKSISQNIEKCFEDLNKAEKVNSNEEEYFTDFIYYIDINDEVSKEAIKVGIEELKKNLPFIFAFNDIIKELWIDDEKFENSNVKRNIKKKCYKYKDSEIIVAIAIKDNEVIDLKGIPKIYVGMPLVKTADYINIPFVINCINFITTKERDSLSADKDGINKDFLSQALELYKKLLEDLDLENIKRTFRLIDVQLIPNKEMDGNQLWQDFNDMLKNIFIEIIEKIPLVKTFEGMKEIKNTIFPAYGIIDRLENNIKNELFTKFYSLTKQIKKNIPIEDEIGNWRDISENLKKISDFSPLVSQYSLEEMKRELNDFVKNFSENEKRYPAFNDLGENFKIDDPKQFLHSLYDILDKLYQNKIIFDSYIDPLLLDQEGNIRPKELDDGKLHLDKDIPEELKDILKNIGWVIRIELVDKDFTKYKIVSKYVGENMNTDKALERVIENRYFLLREEDLKKDEWDAKKEGWIELFKWSIKNNKLVVGFPVFTKDGKIQEVKSLNNEELLIPFKHMGIDEKYEDIYPESRILHHKYFDNPNEILDNIGNYKTFIKKLPIYRNALTLGYDKLESILTDKQSVLKVNHKIENNEENISILPFWNEVVGRISEQERGKLLFEFVVKYLINHDDSWEKTVSVNCSCKDKFHKIIPSHWLASLKSDAWVPYKVIENNEEKIVRREARKETIEKLFSREEFEKLIKNNPNKITKILAHFGFDELDLKIKLKSINEHKTESEIKKEVIAVMDTVESVSGLVDMIKSDPESFKEKAKKLVKEWHEKESIEEIKNENKKIGEIVEKIIAKIFENRGFTVMPIYKGADLEIWPEMEGWDSGLIEIKPYLFEVKFTSGSRVFLSKKQAETAQKEKDHYLILVIENAKSLRERLKEIDESFISDDIINDVVENSKIVEGIHEKLGNFPYSDVVEPDLNGYWIKKKLWENNINIYEWIENNI